MNLLAVILITWSVVTPALRINDDYVGTVKKWQSNTFRMLSKEISEELLEDGVLVFIPGLGVDSRVDNVKANVAWLQTQGVPFECLIYKYHNISESDDAFKPCKVIEHKGQWMDHILTVPLNSTRKKYVLHMIDGVSVEKVSLRRMMDTMADNNLVHSAPALYGKHQYTQMAPHLGFGRLVDFIEPQFDLYTRENFACLQDLATPQPGRSYIGWGVDVMMPSVCKGNMGVIDVMKVRKQFVQSYDYKKARQDEKAWAAEHGFKHIGHMQGQYQKNGEKGCLGSLKGTAQKDDPQCDHKQKCWM